MVTEFACGTPTTLTDLSANASSAALGRTYTWELFPSNDCNNTQSTNITGPAIMTTTGINLNWTNLALDISNNCYVLRLTVSFDDGICPPVTQDVKIESETIRCKSDGSNSTSTRTYGNIASHKENIYPNPAGDEMIVSNSNRGIRGITLYKQTGAIAYQIQTNGSNEVKIDVSELPPGPYMLAIKYDDEYVSNQKITIK